MTEENAVRVANVLMLAAAAGTAYYVIRTPRLRRLAWQLGRTALLTWGPVWISREVRGAWAASGRSLA